jgi:quercetin dioxygenase-like cupin family protein
LGEDRLVSRHGQVFENPVTGERAVLLTDPLDHPERVLVVHQSVKPGGRVSVAHHHPVPRERFHVLSGRIAFKIDGEERVLGPGEEAEVGAGIVHDWWQVGDEEAGVLVEVTPGERFTEMVGTFFGLARDGKVDKKGVPHPLQLALSARAYRDTMVVAKPPPWVQRLAFGVLAPIASARGLTPTYPEYLESDIVVEPDPAALAMIGDDGRLRFGT